MKMLFIYKSIIFICLSISIVSPLFAEGPALSGDGSVKTVEGQRETYGSANAISKQIAPLPPIDFSTSLLAMVKGLAICIAILLIVVWVLKKLKSPIVTGQGRALKIIERLPVSTKSSILLVEVNKKRVLIGVGSDPVNLISDFVDSEAFDVNTEDTDTGGKDD